MSAETRRRRLLSRAALLGLCCGALVLLALGAGAGTNGPATAPAAPSPLLVAAAADTRPAFEQLKTLFRQRTGQSVTVTYGSSGTLATQIINGAPFALYASADVGFVDKVIKAGRGVARSKRIYAYGRLTIWTRKGAKRFKDFQSLTGANKIAIANPEHAPYGRAAKQALQNAGVYDEVKDKLVLGENIADTQRLVQSGNADVGIIALSLSKQSDGAYALIAEKRHQRLIQAAVVTGKGAAAKQAQAFIDLISSDGGRRIMNRWGFVLPGDKKQ